MRWVQERESGAHGGVVSSCTELSGGLGGACPTPPSIVPVEVVAGSSSPSNEKVLPVGKIQDKIVLEQLPPRRRMVITLEFCLQ